MTLEELMDTLEDIGEWGDNPTVLIQCEHTGDVKHPIIGVRPKNVKDSNVVEFAIIECNNRDDRWLP